MRNAKQLTRMLRQASYIPVCSSLQNFTHGTTARIPRKSKRGFLRCLLCLEISPPPFLSLHLSLSLSLSLTHTHTHTLSLSLSLSLCLTHSGALSLSLSPPPPLLSLSLVVWGERSPTRSLHLALSVAAHRPVVRISHPSSQFLHVAHLHASSRRPLLSRSAHCTHVTEWVLWRVVNEHSYRQPHLWIVTVMWFCLLCDLTHSYLVRGDIWGNRRRAMIQTCTSIGCRPRHQQRAPQQHAGW